MNRTSAPVRQLHEKEKARVAVIVDAVTKKAAVRACAFARSWQGP